MARCCCSAWAMSVLVYAKNERYAADTADT
jgi:hypothetical protein